MAKFSFNRKVSSEHTVLKWVKPDLTIFEIKTVLPIDTIYKESGKVIKLKPRNFIYHSYVIYPAGKERLLYITEDKEGLYFYQIGDKEYSPMRESIPVNLRTPDVSGILKLAKM